MKVLLIGGTGYVGSGIFEELKRGRHAVTVPARTDAKAETVRRYGGTPLPANLRDPEPLARAAREHDAIVYAGFEPSPDGVAIEKKALDEILAALAKIDLPKIFIYTSGVWVLGETGDSPVDESIPLTHPAPIVAWRPAHETKTLEAGRGLLATAVIRPGMVYGGSGGLCAPFFSTAEKEGESRYVGDGGNRWSLIHRNDLGMLYRIVMEKRATGIFHAVEEKPIRVLELARAASEACGKNRAARSIPLEEARRQMGPVADALCLDQVVSSKRSRAIGWTPAHPPFVESAPNLYREFKTVGNIRKSQ